MAMLHRSVASSATARPPYLSPAQRLPALPQRRQAVAPLHRCRATMPDESKLEDTPGVQSLLARDMKQPKVQAELAGDPFAAPAAAIEEPTASTSTQSAAERRAERIKSKRERRNRMAQAAGLETPEGAEAPAGPKKCKEAIDMGLELFQQRKYQEAIAMFNLALELPGQGAYRLPNSPREYSCPSDGEENAALYNMACAYAALNQRDSALTCLEAVLENGYDDYKGMVSDHDLRPLGRALDDLVGKYSSPVTKVAKGLFGAVGEIVGGKKELVSSTERKPWILW